MIQDVFSKSIRCAWFTECLLAAALLLTGPARPAQAGTVVVKPGSMGGWAFNTADNNGNPPAADGTSGTGFTVGPATPPLGAGSAHLFTGNGTVGGDESAQLRNTGYAGVKLSQVTNLRYCTYGNKWNGQQLPYLSLMVDSTGSGTAPDDQIFFEPAYQTATSGNPCLPDQGAAVLSTWQCWDVLDGGWWANSGGGSGTTGCTPGSTGPLVCPYTAGSNPPSGICSLADYIAQHPNATIRNNTNGLGGVRINVGFASPTDQFDGSADEVIIGVSGGDTTFDFEPCGSRFVATTGSDTGNDCGSPASPCATVQHAVDQACSGDTVNIAAGTYAEQVMVTKSLTITGAGAGSSIIQAPAVLNGDANGFKNIFTISGGGVSTEISGLTLNGPGPSGCGSINAGIFVRDGANANIHDNTISDIRDNPLSGCQNGQGIWVGRQAFATTGTATIANNVITGYQKTGIVVDNAGSSATVLNNQVTGVGATPLIAQNGIQVSRGATASVSGNQVAGNECDDTSAGCGADPVNDVQSVGILLYQAGSGTAVSANNDVSANDIGIYNLADGTTVTGNAVSNNRYEDVFLDQGSATVTGNDIQGGNIGVIAVAFTGNTENSAGTVGCNRITATGTAIDLIDQDPADTVVPSVSATTNVIAGNALGVNASGVPAGPAMNATSDYWGCSTGPGTAGCDSVVGNVQAVPFAATVPACVYCGADSDCNDGLACNGVETCNLTAHVCVPGTPVDCSALNGACSVGSCTEPSGSCVAVAKPDNTLCTSGGASCQTGVCVGANSLGVAAVRLITNTARLVKNSNGSVFVSALVDDNDTGGMLSGNLLAGNVTLEVQDSGVFHVIISMKNCRIGASSGRITCNDPTTRTAVAFTHVRYFTRTYGFVYRVTARRRGLGTAVTGSGQPQGPVHIVLHQVPVLDRPAELTTCSATGPNRLLCHN